MLHSSKQGTPVVGVTVGVDVLVGVIVGVNPLVGVTVGVLVGVGEGSGTVNSNVTQSGLCDESDTFPGVNVPNNDVVYGGDVCIVYN
jgi:hypothetical protein